VVVGQYRPVALSQVQLDQAPTAQVQPLGGTSYYQSAKPRGNWVAVSVSSAGQWTDYGQETRRSGVSQGFGSGDPGDE